MVLNIQHYTEEGKSKNNFRTDILEGYDLKIIRFTNGQVDENFVGVCKNIDMVVKQELPHRYRGAPRRMSLCGDAFAEKLIFTRGRFFIGV